MNQRLNESPCRHLPPATHSPQATRPRENVWQNGLPIAYPWTAELSEVPTRRHKRAGLPMGARRSVGGAAFDSLAQGCRTGPWD